MKIVNIIYILALSSIHAFAQSQVVSINLFKLANDHKLQVFNREVSPISEGDKKGIRLLAKENDGVAWIDGLSFSNGIIELDVRGKDVLQQSFVGVAFHGADEKQLDAVYFRPFNFRAADPIRKIHAVQYVSQGLS